MGENRAGKKRFRGILAGIAEMAAAAVFAVLVVDIFGGLGGLTKGLSGFMPKDDPNGKLVG